MLAGERGDYRLVRAVEAIQVPATVQAVLAARIDRLPPDEKRLLQAAAVIGEEVPFALLQAIAEESEEALRRGLAHLQAAEFLYEASLFPDLEYTFKHGLTYQVAYGSLLQDRRRSLHGRIVEAIERLHTDRLAEHVERLAHHAFRGELWEKAVPYHRQAGAKAFARSANREAVAYFEQALSALSHLPESREALEQAIDVRLDLRNSLFPLGEIEKMFAYLGEAEGLARTLDDPRRVASVSVMMSHSLLLVGRSEEARTYAQSAQAVAETLGDFALTVSAGVYLGAACLALGDHRRAEDSLRKVVQSLEADRGRERFGLHGFPAVLSRCYLAWTLAERGRFDEGIAHGQEGVRLAEAVDHPYSLVFACWTLGYLYAVKGDFGHAIRLFEHGRALSLHWSLTITAATLTRLVGYAYVLSGRVAEGLPLLREGVRASESLGVSYFRSLTLAEVSEASLLAGRLEDAREFAGEALALARERAERGYEACALRLLGDIASHPDPPEAATAEGYYRQALALADELGMRPLVAHCHLGLGALCSKTGKIAQARAELASATELFRAMDMTFWLARAEAELEKTE